jgi:hypothetical protein
MAEIPPNLNIIYQNLTGFRKSLIRFYPDRTGVINANDVLRWTLPKEKMLMDTLTHYFEFTSTAAASGSSSHRQGTFFPRNSASIIDTITVFINGMVFENITNYNHLFNLIYDNVAGYNYYHSGVRALECSDPSIRYTVSNASGNAITATVQGGTSTATTNASSSDNKRPIHITNWVGLLGTCNRVLDLTNVEVVIEIRYAPANILWKGVVVAAGETALTPSYTIDQYYMTIQKISFDDDFYDMAINSLKASGNYTITFKTTTASRSGSVAKTTNPNLQFSTTAKNLSKLYFTFIDGTYETISQILNTSKTTSFSEQLANLRTNVDAYNQCKYFQKNAVSLTEIQAEINGIPVYPFPQPLHLIHNNNYEALDTEDDIHTANYVGCQSLESWTKYCFLMATSFEHKDAWKNNIISGYPNTSRNLLNIKYSCTFAGTATDNVYLLAFAERVVECKFMGGSVTIDM